MSRIGELARTFFGDLRGRALLVVLGCLVCQMGLAYGYVINALARDIMTEMEWSRSVFSFTRVPQLAVMSLCSPLVGGLIVRHGSRPILTAALAVLGATFWAMSRMQGLYEYYALMMLLGVALTGVGDITVGHVVSRWVERGRGFALGLVYVGSNLGGVLLIPLAASIADEYEWRTALLTLGLGALLVMLPCALLLVRDREPETGVGGAEAGSAGAVARNVVVEEGGDDLDIRDALRTRSFWLLFFSLWAFFFYFLALLEHMVLFLTDQGMPRSDAAARYATAVGLGIWSKLGLGLIADRIHEKATLLLDYGLLALSSFVLLWLPDDALIWVFVASFGISYAARDVVYPLIVNRCFGLRYMARIYGVLMLALVLGAAGPVFAAAMHDRFGSYVLAFQCFGVLNLVSLAGLAFVRDERRVAASRS